MRGLTLNERQDKFRALTPTMRVLTNEEIYDVSGGDPGASARRLFNYAEAAAGGALAGGVAGFAVGGPLGALGFGLLGATYGLAGAGLQTAFNQVAWLNIVG
ncbi:MULTISPECIES: hypothetical protein [Acidithiobacillus]|uniref:Bacteriocin n=2 Tax=Acidithiobacillus TaxID=119977 RepID=A0A179BGQ6_ACIFR|nr:MULTISPECIES: hypothetical protein [Acidithiobacillus]MDA8182558.1 hypothetical protein [Acidithiobacillus sp.]MBU2832703.1 hypothetical protein [Acidithiobacillus ferriphilus]MBU2854619.1 hypothetical protein [Acidithiobacillus ferriphilus]MEB8486538.1 hypothetical protein [Acidithiobacillus ferriphilus]MEB8490583.1 hypothetical protein [Acidithiobacillus ferriphilus]